MKQSETETSMIMHQLVLNENSACM